MVIQPEKSDAARKTTDITIALTEEIFFLVNKGYPFFII